MSTFGVPITTETVGALPSYRDKQQITQEDCARVAMSWIHAEDKNLKALQHALDIKSNYGSGVSAMVLVYNATGDTLELVGEQDWHGSVYHEPVPRSFENGQWLAFLHAHPQGMPLGCEAARVFRGRNVEGGDRDYMIAWYVHWDTEQNCAYTEVREKDHFKRYWNYLKDKCLEKAGKVCRDETDQHCASTVSIGGYTSAECIAVLRHKFSPLTENA